jgi:hypothetical protein
MAAMVIRNKTANLLFLLLLSSRCICAQKPVTPAEQLQFSAENEHVQHPIVMPDELWTVLRQHPFVADGLEIHKDQASAEAEERRAWFEVSRVHLGDTDEQDFIVVGTGEMVGANTVPFWIFKQTAHGMKLMLFSQGHDLNILSHLHNGHRDIEISYVFRLKGQWQTYRYSNEAYSLSSDTGNKTK